MSGLHDAPTVPLPEAQRPEPARVRVAPTYPPAAPDEVQADSLPFVEPLPELPQPSFTDLPLPDRQLSVATLSPAETDAYEDSALAEEPPTLADPATPAPPALPSLPLQSPTADPLAGVEFLLRQALQQLEAIKHHTEDSAKQGTQLVSMVHNLQTSQLGAILQQPIPIPPAASAAGGLTSALQEPCQRSLERLGMPPLVAKGVVVVVTAGFGAAAYAALDTGLGPLVFEWLLGGGP